MNLICVRIWAKTQLVIRLNGAIFDVVCIADFSTQKNFSEELGLEKRSNRIVFVECWFNA